MFPKNLSLSRVVLLGSIASLLTFCYIFPRLARAKYVDRYPRCTGNLRQIGLGLRIYAADYGGYLPVTVSGGPTNGWADALFPYVKSSQVYQCPEEPGAGQSNPKLNGYIDYVFNTTYSGARTKTLKPSSRLVLLVEGNDGTATTDARYAASVIPQGWNFTTSSPL